MTFYSGVLKIIRRVAPHVFSLHYYATNKVSFHIQSDSWVPYIGVEAFPVKGFRVGMQLFKGYIEYRYGLKGRIIYLSTFSIKPIR